MPESSENSVLFPAPFGPSKPKHEPFLTLKLTFDRAGRWARG
jgi:hypothetical protein